MARDHEAPRQDHAPPRHAGRRQTQGPRSLRPRPKADVLTLADDGGIGGDPYNSAERWARPDRRDD